MINVTPEQLKQLARLAKDANGNVGVTQGVLDAYGHGDLLVTFATKDHYLKHLGVNRSGQVIPA